MQGPGGMEAGDWNEDVPGVSSISVVGDLATVHPLWPHSWGTSWEDISIWLSINPGLFIGSGPRVDLWLSSG